MNPTWTQSERDRRALVEAGATGLAIWRRLHLIPFGVTIPEGERDHRLPEKLKAEAEGILAWLVEGCLQWQKHGLNPPEALRNATAEYRSDMDTIGQFLDECTRHVPNLTTTASDLYTRYRGCWCEDSGLRAASRQGFGRKLKERGYVNKPKRDGVVWHGLVLL